VIALVFGRENQSGDYRRLGSKFGLVIPAPASRH
jgi:hypothetical protein